MEDGLRIYNVDPLVEKAHYGQWCKGIHLFMLNIIRLLNAAYLAKLFCHSHINNFKVIIYF